MAVSERCAIRRPIRTSRNLYDASGVLVTASVRLEWAARGLAEANRWIALHPEAAAGLPELLMEATERWIYVAQCLDGAAGNLFGLHHDVLQGLQTGELVPERPAEPRRRRIALVPRPAPVYAFLRARLRRVVDRISSVLQRRRRTRRPAALRVPRRTCQGRAPPLFLVCLL